VHLYIFFIAADKNSTRKTHNYFRVFTNIFFKQLLFFLTILGRSASAIVKEFNTSRQRGPA
jgi:hypothetical protein